jgi:hypothetical protein
VINLSAGHKEKTNEREKARNPIRAAAAAFVSSAAFEIAPFLYKKSKHLHIRPVLRAGAFGRGLDGPC